MLAPLVRTAAAQVGLPREENPVAEHTSACLANADLPIEEARLRKAIEKQGWTRSVSVLNDTFGVLRAGTDDGCGAAVVCGAGVNCVGLLSDG